VNVVRTGLDSATLIPVGSVIKQAYWVATGTYTIGDRFDTLDLALEDAIRDTEMLVKRHNAHYLSLPGTKFLPLPERIIIDFRWDLGYPGGGGIDLVAQRNEYPTLEDAREALALYRKFMVKP